MKYFVKPSIIFFQIIVVFICSQCKKEENEHFSVRLKLNNETYIFKNGHAQNLHDAFDFMQLVGRSEDNRNGITIDYKLTQDSVYSINDTIAVYININNTDFYIVSNWSTNRPYAKVGESFDLGITYEDDEIIKGEFEGKLFHFDVESTENELEEVELKEGLFKLFKK